MDRNEFIKKFQTASSQLDMKKARDVMSNCIRRHREQYGKDKAEAVMHVAIMEECAELSEAIARKVRGRDEDNYALMEESADVIIDILALMDMNGILSEQMARAINVKLDREAERIRQHDEDRKMLSKL